MGIQIISENVYIIPAQIRKNILNTFLKSIVNIYFNLYSEYFLKVFFTILFNNCYVMTLQQIPPNIHMCI